MNENNNGLEVKEKKNGVSPLIVCLFILLLVIALGLGWYLGNMAYDKEKEVEDNLTSNALDTKESSTTNEDNKTTTNNSTSKTSESGTSSNKDTDAGTLITDKTMAELYGKTFIYVGNGCGEYISFSEDGTATGAEGTIHGSGWSFSGTYTLEEDGIIYIINDKCKPTITSSSEPNYYEYPNCGRLYKYPYTDKGLRIGSEEYGYSFLTESDVETYKKLMEAEHKKIDEEIIAKGGTGCSNLDF